jgi:glutathione S-transferase
MIKLYHAPMTRSIRIYWLLEELGIPYELSLVSFTPAKLPFSQAVPWGKLPAIEDDWVTMFESGAILEYVLERYGNGRLAPKPGTPERAAFLQWVHFAEAAAAAARRHRPPHDLRAEAERIPAVVDDARQRVAACLAVIGALDGQDYLLGANSRRPTS